MAKNKVIKSEDIRIPCGMCNIIAKRDEEGDIRIQSVVGDNVLSDILIPADAIPPIVDYLNSF